MDAFCPGRIRSFSPYTGIMSCVLFISHNVSYNGRKNPGLSVLPRPWFFRVNDNFGRFENHKFWPRRHRSSAVDEGTIYHESRRIDATPAPTVLPPSPYSVADDVEEAPPVFAVQMSRAKKLANHRGKKIKQSAAPGNVGGRKIKLKARTNREG